MREHDLKVWPQFYGALESGAKTFELRKNDRRFQVGDTLRLREWDQATREYTGREVWRRVTYILADSSMFDVLQEGYAILGLAASEDQIADGMGLSGHLVVTNEKAPLKADPHQNINRIRGLAEDLMRFHALDRATTIRILTKIRDEVETIEDIYDV